MQRPHNFFEKVYVSTTNFADTKVEWSFVSTSIMLLNLDDSAVVEYSFGDDGQLPHGDLDPNEASAGLVFDNRAESWVYFRLVEPGASVVVRVEAWGP